MLDQDLVAVPTTTTEKEIRRQPTVLRTVAARLRSSRTAIDGFVEPFRAPGTARIVLTGAGTSAFVGEIAAPALSRALGRPVEAIATTDLVSSPESHLVPDAPVLLVSFARSGNSPESLAATAVVDALVSDVRHLVVTCDPEGALYQAHAGRSDSLVLTIPEANDAAFAMTSSFTSMLVTVVAALLGDDAVDVDSVAQAAQEVIDAVERIRAVVRLGPRRVVYLGSGPLTGLAREAALKTLELTAGRTVAYFDSALGFRHGPKSVLDDETVVVVFVSGDPYTRRYDEDIVEELRAELGERVVVVASAPLRDGLHVDHLLPGLDGTQDAAAAAAFVVFAQLLAVLLSAELGVTTDNPFPGGAVNRVVRGVTIHPVAGRQP